MFKKFQKGTPKSGTLVNMVMNFLKKKNVLSKKKKKKILHHGVN
jgi:hypothetical protein